jgi:hypothetical protein
MPCTLQHAFFPRNPLPLTKSSIMRVFGLHFNPVPTSASPAPSLPSLHHHPPRLHTPMAKRSPQARPPSTRPSPHRWRWPSGASSPTKLQSMKRVADCWEQTFWWNPWQGFFRVYFSFSGSISGSISARHFPHQLVDWHRPSQSQKGQQLRQLPRWGSCWQSSMPWS